MLTKYLYAELPTWALLVEMIVAGLVVVFAGSSLTRLADRIANRLQLGSGWVGLILLATVTSLPEVVAGGTSVWIGNADMAFAAIFGSCAFNITIIVLLDTLLRTHPVLYKASAVHVLTSSFGIVLISIALLGIVLVHKFHGVSPVVAQGSEISCALLILLVYPFCVRMSFKYEQRTLKDVPAPVDEPEPKPATRGERLFTKVFVVAMLLVGAAWWLAQTGDVLSTHEIGLIGRPLGATFVGACFLALATSLPEIVTGVTAVRIGNLDMALGNIFGSNMFNIFVIPMLKVVSVVRGDSFLMHGASFHANQNILAGVLPVLLTAIAMAGLTYRSERRVLRRLGFDSALIGLAYLGGMFLLLQQVPG